MAIVTAPELALTDFVPQTRLGRVRAAVKRFVLRQPLGAFCAAIVALIVLVSMFADVVAPYGATQINTGEPLLSPSMDHPMGTDNFGRDVLSRIIHGARISLIVGLVATLLATSIATVVGVLSGYLGGVVDLVVQRFVDTAQAIPGLIMLISIMLVLGPSITNVILALGTIVGLSLTRVIRGAVLGIKFLPYVDAERAIGASTLRIAALHVLPNVFPTIIVLFSIGVGGNIVAEASLSFLGYGVPPPDPTWGNMLSADGRLYMLIQPWLLVFPVVALAILVYSLNMFGDALRDELDPRLRGSR